jgi:tripeptide aminopeptidase
VRRGYSLHEADGAADEMKVSNWRSLVRASLAIGVVVVGCAVSASASAQSVDPDRQARRLYGSAGFRAMKAELARGYDQTVRDLITLTQIPAPPFQEAAKGEAFAAMLREAGLSDVTIDAAGNVVGIRKGGGGSAVVVAAHLDTVFPPGTDVTVKREGDKLHAPGVADDSCSLAVLLAYVRAMTAANVRTRFDIVFVGDVGEEGLGDLRGVRYLFGKSPIKQNIRYFITFEPLPLARITNAGVGSKRYEIAFHGPGGHSYKAFGLVSPAYALGDAMARIGEVKVPEKPVTTYNVGVVEGGTSVNSIPLAMKMAVDMRSEAQASLDAVERDILAIPKAAADRENAARSTREGRITYTVKPLGDRPVGRVAETATITRIAVAVLRAGGLTPTFGSESTDANLPMSLGVEALSLSPGFEGSRMHSLDEYLTLDKPKNVDGMAAGLATILLLAGAH